MLEVRQRHDHIKQEWRRVSLISRYLKPEVRTPDMVTTIKVVTHNQFQDYEMRL